MGKLFLLLVVGVGAAAVASLEVVSKLIGDAIDAIDLNASEW